MRLILFTILTMGLMLAVRLVMFPVAAQPLALSLAPGSINDLTKTPGDIRTTDKTTICTQRTRDIRNVSSATKRQAYKLYGLTKTTGWCKAKGCEVDHLISLELGGSNDIKNLWPQPYAGKWNARVKDALENKLHALICSGSVAPEVAQKAISLNWIGAYLKYVNAKGPN